MKQRPPLTSLPAAILSPANLALIVLGLASLALYAFVAKAASAHDIVWFIKLALLQAVLYLVAVWLVLRAPHAPSTLMLVIALAALFRLAILFMPPYLSDDIYRYVWDGRVQAAGINPYRYIPADAALAHLRDEAIYPKINRRDYAPTIYPPIAQALYLLATRVSESVTWMKFVMVCGEALAIWCVLLLLNSFSLPPQRALLYAWHPLVCWEFAGSGHVDAAAIAFIALALLARRGGQQTLTGIALAGAALVKLFPLVLLPALYRRWGWKTPVAFSVVIGGAYLPYLGAGVTGVLGFLPDYVVEEGLQGGERFYLLSLARKVFGEAGVPSVVYFGFVLLTMSIIALWALWRRERTAQSFVTGAFVLALVFTLLLTPHYAWYFTWLIPFLCLLPPAYLAPPLYLTTASFVIYASWIGDAPEQMFIWYTMLYLPFALLCIIAFWKQRDEATARGEQKFG